jgi:hypothetical protein
VIFFSGLLRNSHMRQGGLLLCVLAGDSQSIPYRDNNLVPFGIVAVSTLRGCLVFKKPWRGKGHKIIGG